MAYISFLISAGDVIDLVAGLGFVEVRGGGENSKYLVPRQPDENRNEVSANRPG